MQKLFKRLLDLLNIHPDENQRWTLSTLFIVGLLDAYVGPAISKAWVTELPAEWLYCRVTAHLTWRMREADHRLHR